MSSRPHPLSLAHALLLAGFAALIRAPAADAPESSSARAPNVVVILADDLGWGGISCQGGQVPTPHIDALAAGGLRFTDAYAAAPICGPSRAGLLTGRNPSRYGFEFNWINLLPATEATIAEILRRRGYATACIGKWHLGHLAGSQPLQRGFDEFYGDIGGISDYLPTAKRPELRFWRGTPQRFAAGQGMVARGQHMRGIESEVEREYATDAFAREACAVIDRHRDRPFFLYLAPSAVHEPLQADAARLARFPVERFAGAADPERARIAAAMLSAFDDLVGRVVAALEAAGLRDRTLIVLTSDNGGHPEVNASPNTPLRGKKGELWEGGIRVPFIANWPQRIPAGRVSAQPISALDLLPTCADLAGAALPAGRPLDGRSLVPLLAGMTGVSPHDAHWWRRGAQAAIRHGTWKLVRIGTAAPTLYDLATDVDEAHDLASQRPEIVRDLAARLERACADLPPPAWTEAAAETP